MPGNEDIQWCATTGHRRWFGIVPLQSKVVGYVRAVANAFRLSFPNINQRVLFICLKWLGSQFLPQLMKYQSMGRYLSKIDEVAQLREPVSLPCGIHTKVHTTGICVFSRSVASRRTRENFGRIRFLCFSTIGIDIKVIECIINAVETCLGFRSRFGKVIFIYKALFNKEPIRK